ncbi:uncharacterized protein LOC132558876 [Ylistrum balloti]|uniref:uncharacterized protein LOC132558876 n=1 Tax=Ylistrum balloti TaxID=509963 RepID=UPI002905DFAD|nr:uncharacterized protein LOC132558876 [Ylistrum balloti]
MVAKWAGEGLSIDVAAIARDFWWVVKAPYFFCEPIMESCTGSPPKKTNCRMRILKEETIDSLVKGREIAGHIKHIIKDRLGYESSQLHLIEKQTNSTLKSLNDSASKYGLFENFKEKYQAYMKSTVILQQGMVSKLAEVNGPYETMKRWLDNPTTKSRPEELKKQYSNLLDDHASKITLLKKEKKALTKVREQLTSCQKKLQNVQAALQISVNLDVDVSARQIKEQRTLKGLEKELINHLDKILRQCQALMIEEAESRKFLEEGMIRIAGEIEKFEEERVKVSNAAMNKFVQILNQQETNRTEKTQATLDLMASVSPRFIDLPKVSLKTKDHAFFYKFPNIAEQLREMGLSETATAPEPVYRQMFGSPNTDSTTSSPQESSSIQSSFSKGSNDGEHSNDKVKNLSKTKTTDENINKTSRQMTHERMEQTKNPKKVRKTVKKEEMSTVQELSITISPQPVDEETPVRKFSMPSQDSDEEDDAPPPHVCRQGWVSSEEEQVSVNKMEQDISQRDVAQYPYHGVPLEQCRLLKALVTHSSSDNTSLSFEKGQKLVQTHKATEEGIAYGYTGKHSYSKVKYGYFSLRQMKTWKPTTKNIIKNLFT